MALIDWSDELSVGHEERMMRARGYPDFDHHKSLHDDLVQQVLAIKEDHQAGKLGVSLELMNFLRKWLTDHILETDKKLAGFLSS
ncbi:MAG: hemerythrin domain-containing protein [Sphingomonadales bacterium]